MYRVAGCLLVTMAVSNFLGGKRPAQKIIDSIYQSFLGYILNLSDFNLITPTFVTVIKICATKCNHTLLNDLASKYVVAAAAGPAIKNIGTTLDCPISIIYVTGIAVAIVRRSIWRARGTVREWFASDESKQAVRNSEYNGCGWYVIIAEKWTAADISVLLIRRRFAI